MSYSCSRCGKEAYYDGRCGDGPILMCNCDKYYTDGDNSIPADRNARIYYDGRCGDGKIVITDAHPQKDEKGDR